MNKETIFRVTLFNSTYDGDLEPIIKGCKLLAEKNQGVKKTNNHGYQSTDDLHRICLARTTALSVVDARDYFLRAQIFCASQPRAESAVALLAHPAHRPGGGR